jgi:hypothetical protein
MIHLLLDVRMEVKSTLKRKIEESLLSIVEETLLKNVLKEVKIVPTQLLERELRLLKMLENLNINK